MKTIHESVGSELRWTQSRALKREYELSSGGQTVATLVFRSPFGTFATGESAEGRWTFKRAGFLATRVTIRSADSDDDIAVFRNNTWGNGGTLELPDRREFRANVNFWMTQFQFLTKADRPLVTFRRIGGVLHLSSVVEVRREAIEMPELPWLLILGWYLTVMNHDDAASTVI